MDMELKTPWAKRYPSGRSNVMAQYRVSLSLRDLHQPETNPGPIKGRWIVLLLKTVISPGERVPLPSISRLRLVPVSNNMLRKKFCSQYCVGREDGDKLGEADGAAVGEADGVEVGANDTDGRLEGEEVGCTD